MHIGSQAYSSSATIALGLAGLTLVVHMYTSQCVLRGLGLCSRLFAIPRSLPCCAVCAYTFCTSHSYFEWLAHSIYMHCVIGPCIPLRTVESVAEACADSVAGWVASLPDRPTD